MSLALIGKVQELEKRVAALERTVTASPRRYGVLYAQAARKRADGEALRAEIAALVKAHPGQKAYTIRSYLTRDPLPSLRRVQQVVQAVKRNATGIAPDASAPAGTHKV